MIIEGFDKEFRFLSNFWYCYLEVEGEVYLSVEHAYQAAKTTDPVLRREIREAPDARAAKKLSKKIKKTLRQDWDDVKLGIMEDLLRQKFQDPDLRKALELTRPHVLEETNWWGDRYWGVCRGVGENHLGKLLMKIRDDS
jgi:ribA/ribD-fused uncharacterized protein